MANAIEAVAHTYIRAWSERDPALRERLLEECFAADGRFVTRRRVIRGRAALAAEMERFHARAQWRSIRRLSVIDTGDTTFRWRGAVEFHDGTIAEAFDAGEIDADGKIVLLLTFDGPLADADHAAR
jgi:hypothetical protein